MSQYPESDKLSRLMDERLAIQSFLEELGYNGVYLGRHVVPEGYIQEVFVPLSKSPDDIVMDYLGIDTVELEQERRRMLEGLRNDVDD